MSTPTITEMKTMSTKKVQLYTMSYCPFCVRAKKLLTQRGVEFEEILVGEEDDQQWDLLFKRSGMKTMPQIFHGDQVIGGFNELSELDRLDALKSLRS